jgi:hypothetical protein
MSQFPLINEDYDGFEDIEDFYKKKKVHLNFNVRFEVCLC